MSRIQYFHTREEAQKEASGLMGHYDVKIHKVDFGTFAEEAGLPRFGYYIQTHLGVLHTDGYFK